MAEWVHFLRVYCVVVASLVALVGALQFRHWRTFLPENQLAWLALAGLNFAVWFGSIEALLDGARGGDRNGVIAAAVTLELFAVLWRPVHNFARWRTARRLIRRGK